ncbi:hypothetical protein [Rhizobium leguminosarum]|uniref:hypothetical protein n=1 Tax=Rhizobium leguminosarum TaxID=384 RepID=UPI001C90A099|nr:hypothetical protein [Rhizobium leguminosarum]MBY3002059.1 peptidase [Rhizobium leguminosarum]
MTCSRRMFLATVAASGLSAFVSAPAVAKTGNAVATAATAVTEVFGDGIKLVAVAVEYSSPVSGKGLSTRSFLVDGRTVTDVFVSRSSDPADRAEIGHFVIVALSPNDEGAGLAERVQSSPSGESGSSKTAGGPGNAGDIPPYDTVYRTPRAAVSQTDSVRDASGGIIKATRRQIMTTSVNNLVVDDFRQLEFHDPAMNRTLRYNLFVPRNYDASKSYPLVLFMHDAGATSDVTRTTLFQGLGAVCWASPEDQKARPAFVLAPQYPEIIADDQSRTSNALGATINLIAALGDIYNIDRKRIYATGQSGGCMMSIAMNIRHPDLFAASFLVAGQWEPALVRPLAKKKLWILVSQDDDKAWPGETSIVDVLEKEEATVSREIWSGTWDAERFDVAFHEMVRHRADVNFVAFKSGTVIPAGQPTAGASGHRNTWRLAYAIPQIRQWVFDQSL